MFYSNKGRKSTNDILVVQIRTFEKKHMHQNLELNELLQSARIGETSEALPTVPYKVAY